MSHSSDNSDGEGETPSTCTPQSSGRSSRAFMNIFHAFGNSRRPTSSNVTPMVEEESPQPYDEGCTAFHIVCQKANSLEEVQFEFDAVALEKQSSTGKNCLHYLTLNAELILSIKKGNGFHRQIMKSIDLDKASRLVTFIVDAICFVEKDKKCLLLEADREGRIPFQEVMENWIRSVENNTGRQTNIIDLSTILPVHFSESTSYDLYESHRSPSQLQLFSSQETQHALFSLYLLSEIMQRLKAKVKQGELPFIEWRNKSERMLTKSPPPSSRRLFSFSKTPSTSGAFSILSNGDSLSIATVFEKVSKIDNFIKTLLTVVIGREEREAIFSLSLIRNVMIQQNNVGPWIIDMLDSPSDHTRTNIIDYFKRLSTLTENKRIDSDDSQLDELDDLADKLGRLHGLIPSMMALSTIMTEEAATIPLIARALDKKMLSPFVSCALFFDILMLVLLLFTFRLTANSFMRGVTLSPWAYYLANTAIYYFILRIWGKLISLYYFFKRYKLLHFRFSKIWGILDTFSVLLSWICIWLIGYLGRKDEVENISDALRIFIAVTTVLLWLHLIGTLTVVNVKLATFVLAIRKITQEVLWYLFLLACFGLCSSQVLFTLMIPKGDCIGNDADDKLYCSSQFYYSKVYAAVLGLDEWGFKIDGEDSPTFHKTLFSEVMYGILSFIIMILLLNSLIAVISDSYESCLLRSKRLFGRARIQFLGGTLAFKNLFVKSSEVEKQHWSHGGYTFLVSSMIVYAGFVLFELFVIKKVESRRTKADALEPNTDYKIWMYASFTLNVCVTVCFNVILTEQVQAMTQNGFEGVFTKTFFLPLNIIRWVIWRLQGTRTRLSYVDSNDGPEEWSGRVSYLKGEIDRVGEEHKKEIWNLRSQMMQSEIDVVDRLENLLRNQQSEVLNRLEALEERQRRVESKITL